MTFWQFAFKNVTRNARAYFAYFVSSAFSIAIFFSFAVYLFHPKLHMTGVNAALNILMTISEVVIVFFSFFFLLYSIGTFLKVRKKQFGILTVLGISPKQLKEARISRKHANWWPIHIFRHSIWPCLFTVLFISYRQNYACAWFIFILVAYSCYRFNYNYLSWTLHSRIIFYTDANPYEKSCTSFKRRNKTKRKKSICTHLSLWCDMFNIWICFSSKPTIFYVTRRYRWAFVRCLLYICHPITCCSWNIFFFSQISFLLIRILKTRRKFYMKRINMLWVSDLATRIRTNINMLFIVTMLSTLAFTMITFLYGFGKFTKFDEIRQNPFPFTYLSHTENTLADEHLNWLEQKFNEEQFAYKKFKTDIYEVSSAEDNAQLYYAIKQSDYNILAKALNWKRSP